MVSHSATRDRRPGAFPAGRNGGMSEREAQPDSATFEAFRQRVFADPDLQARLRPVMDRTAFIDLVVTMGAETGYTFSTRDVTAVMERGQFAWLTHWWPVI
jgi:Nif11 domain